MLQVWITIYAKEKIRYKYSIFNSGKWKKKRLNDGNYDFS